MRRIPILCWLACVGVAAAGQAGPVVTVTGGQAQGPRTVVEGISKNVARPSAGTGATANQTKSTIPENKGAQPTDSGHPGPSSESLMLVFTFVIAAAAVAQAFIYWRQARLMQHTLLETKRSADAALGAAQIAINSERAWVFLESMRGAHEHAMRHIVRFKNLGRTPAWFDEVGVAYVGSDSEITEVDWSQVVRTRYDQAVITGEATPEFVAKLDVSRYADIAHESTNYFQHVYGVAKYRDIAGQLRETTFCLTFYPDSSGGGQWKKSGPPEANRNT